MKKTRVALLPLVALMSFSSQASSQYKPGELIVKYKEDTQRTRLKMNALFEGAHIDAVKHLSNQGGGIDHVTLAPGVQMEDALASFRANPMVEYAQPNYILHAQPLEIVLPHSNLIPVSGPDLDSLGRPGLSPLPDEVSPEREDPALAKEYGLGKIGAKEAWKDNRGDKSFIVGIIDTGIDYNHEDLAYNVWRAKAEDGHEYVGYDFVHSDDLPFDDCDHGTHAAGTIGAVGGNGLGISGVSPRVSLMALKFMDSRGAGETSDAIKAIDFAVAHGARVLNNSWDGDADDLNPALQQAIARAQAKGVLFVVAAGNESSNDDIKPTYPASFRNDNMLVVAATDASDKLAKFSNYGMRTTHLAAPGVDIYSTMPGDQYDFMSGTSMAAPHVTGAVALLWSTHPELSYKQVKSLILKSVDPLPGLRGKVSSGGRLNVLRALKAAAAETAAGHLPLP